MGTLRTAQKEIIQWEIDKQLELRSDGLLEEDQYLTEIILGDIEQDFGKRHKYWLLAITAAREATKLTTHTRGAIKIDTG